MITLGTRARIGETPLIRIEPRYVRNRGDGGHGEIFAKTEWENPGGSVKDRPVWRMIHEAWRHGSLVPGKRLLDASSGNTAVAYAMISAWFDYPVTLVIPANTSRGKREKILHFGAEIIQSDPLEGSDGAVRLARRMVDERPDGYVYLDQYNNDANWQAHYDTTALEIWEQTNGRVTHLVAGVGTSGTLLGTGKRLKELNPSIRVVAVEPEEEFHGLEGLKNMRAAVVPGIYRKFSHLIDDTIHVSTDDAYDVLRDERRHGLLLGSSSAANLLGARRVAAQLDEGVVVTVFPDREVPQGVLWDRKARDYVLEVGWR